MPTLLAPQRTAVHPTFTRESISWRALEGGIVEICVELANLGEGETTADTLVIEAAPLGAFVPNLPIARVAVGSLDPGERRTVSTQAPRSFLDGLGAVGDQMQGLRQAFQAFLDPKASHHWIGNLNVYFERGPEHAVERHCAFGLKVPAGSRVGAMFMVRDAEDYSIQTECSNSGWKAEASCTPGVVALLTVRTPDEPGESALVTANVTRTLDGRTVPVEFEFETVNGWGEVVGCVQV